MNRSPPDAPHDRSPDGGPRKSIFGWMKRSPKTQPPDASPPVLPEAAPAPPEAPPEPSFEVGPITDIPWPKISLDEHANPVPALVQSADFAECAQFFADCPSTTRSLLPRKARALLYSVIRNLRPDHVLEIGTYKGGTAEGLARAVQANGHGVAHTVSPFDAERFARTVACWPAELQQQVRYHPVDSMAFFITADQERLRLGVVLVDGNHDYEFASFDIQAAAQRLQPGGFIFVDNVSQAGPYFAVRDFLAQHPDWIDCCEALGSPSSTRAFDRERTTIPNTDFIVLRAPSYYSVGNRPKTFGEVGWIDQPVQGLRLSFARPPEAGTLHIQCVLRGFSEALLAEVDGVGQQTIAGGETEIDIALATPISLPGRFDRYLVEPWLTWPNGQPLALNTPPTPF
jgi:predicted O-methyltransferase YrrM